MPKKKKKPVDHTLWKSFLWSIIGISAVIFIAFLILIKITMKNVSRDPSVNTLTNEAVFQMVQLINRDKNTFADRLDECWNQKNPFTDCTPENTIKEGDYILAGKELMWLEGPLSESFPGDNYLVDEERARDTLEVFWKMIKIITNYCIFHTTTKAPPCTSA